MNLQNQSCFEIFIFKSLCHLIHRNLDNIGGRTAFDAAEKGDETGKAIVEQYISYLADGISGIINMFRPEVIVVGGGTMKRMGFLDSAVAYLKEGGMEVALFEGVEPDPSVQTVMRGAVLVVAIWLDNRNAQ